MALQPMQERIELQSPEFPSLETQIERIRAANRPAPFASVQEALSVPAIQRAVTLISHTVGSVSMQGWRNGVPMDPTPIILARPNPYDTPYETYRDMAYYRATRGETILWIANRDGDGLPIALVNIPPWQVQVQGNPLNALRPTYTWGDPTTGDVKQGTRYSVANPNGSFVHIMYHRDDANRLRGIGPLQMCGAAISVAVEAMQWASSFFSGGGVPPIIIKSADGLDPTIKDDTGLTEAQTLKRDWSSGNPNEPKIIDPGIESVQQLDTNPQGAQMLDARQHGNGDAALMFGIPGVLLEYNASGSSLTYQSIPDVWIELLRGCLTPTYFEPFEAALSDLLPRTQAARFNTRALQRADIKTRYDVYNIGVPLGVITPEQAQIEEGYLPGDIEYEPIPPSPPQASAGLSRETRCLGLLSPEAARKRGWKTMDGFDRHCGKKLLAGSRYCSRCKTPVAA
jgi:HK97 family phage portal protein